MALRDYSSDHLFMIQKRFLEGSIPPGRNVRRITAGRSNYMYFVRWDTDPRAWGKSAVFVSARDFSNPKESFSHAITATQIQALREFGRREGADTLWLMYFLIDNVTMTNGYHMMDIELGTMQKFARSSAPGVTGSFLKVNPKGDYYWNLGPGGKYLKDFQEFHQNNKAYFGFSNGRL